MGKSNKSTMYKKTGFRVPLILQASTVAAGGTAPINVTPQMDFRGETIVCDPLTAADLQLQVPTVGTVPQIAGGPPSATMSGQMFPPNQNGALDFTMDISNQGNQFITNFTNTNTSLARTFTVLVFGQEVEVDNSPAAAKSGVARAGNYVG